MPFITANPHHTRVAVDATQRALRLGPLAVHTDDARVTEDGDGVPVYLLPFRRAFFFPAHGYLTWQWIADAFELRCWSGWTRIAGRAYEYGTWLEVDDDTARVFARLAGQQLLVEWTPTFLRITSTGDDALTTTIDLTDDRVAA